MPSFVTASVVGVLAQRPGFQRVALRFEDGTTGRAYVLSDLIGPVEPGHDVVVNTTAVELGLGTGGWDAVHWNLSRSSWRQAGGGHVMKLRYSSLQVDVGVAEEGDGYVEQADLSGMPVVACLLLSQVAMVAMAIKQQRPDCRVGFVMTDQAALPLAFSDLVHDLRSRGLIDVTATAGQAFGGDVEAVNVTSALGVLKSDHRIDVAVVGPGPGVVGTASRLGFSGLEMASVLEQAAQSGGTGIHALRWSDADERDRHRGVSHHSRTVLERTMATVRVGVPAERLDEVDLPSPHLVVPVEVGSDDATSLIRRSGIDVTTMGRAVDADPGFFSFAVAAGRLAVDTFTQGIDLEER